MSEKKKSRQPAPAKTVEGREKQLVALAVDLAEKQLREGTASSQVISHYLKLGSSREKLEQELMQQNIQNVNAKTEAINASKTTAELYEQAINAMRLYSGMRTLEDEEFE